MVDSDCPQLRWNHNNNPAATTTISELLSNIQDNLLSADLTRCEQSSFSSFYHRLKSNGSSESYLSFHTSLNRKRLFCQLRLHPDRLKILSLYTNSNKYVFSPTATCTMCNLNENDDLSHMITKCLVYNPLREKLKIPYRSDGMLNFHKIVRDYNCDQVKDLCNYVEQSLRIRAFIFNE